MDGNVAQLGESCQYLAGPDIEFCAYTTTLDNKNIYLFNY